MRQGNKLITFMILKKVGEKLPDDLKDILKNQGWQVLRPGHIYALFWDQVLVKDTSTTDKLMERVVEVHKIASKLGVKHMFKTVKTSEVNVSYPEFL